MQLKMKTRKARSEAPKKLDINKLACTDYQTRLALAITSALQNKGNMATDTNGIEDYWSQLKETIYNTAREVLGTKRESHPIGSKNMTNQFKNCCKRSAKHTMHTWKRTLRRV